MSIAWERERLLFALALFLFAAACWCISGLLLVHFELCVALLFVPFEACKVGFV